ncbi:hypothetical protein BT93_F3270 [Corymbia citriodora subsp. variegata]|nr:hypothetical protein BT93_F3270 [Corymbia citriodora subsp. variegata]
MDHTGHCILSPPLARLDGMHEFDSFPLWYFYTRKLKIILPILQNFSLMTLGMTHFKSTPRGANDNHSILHLKKIVQQSILLLRLAICFFPGEALMVSASNKTFSVSDYGAVGNGVTNDTSAFAKAWTDACNTETGASTITKGHDPSKWLTVESVNELTVSGQGSFDGRGDGWWNISCKLNPKPILRFHSCDRVTLQDVGFKNSPQTHVTVSGSSNVNLKSLTISAPNSSPNTDGIRLHDSSAVSVQDSKIGSGGDCISIGNQISDISITNIDCGPGHGISIGSLGKSGNEVNVKNIKVRNVNFHGTTNGARIKTWHVGRGRVSQIIFSNLKFTEESGVQISDVRYQKAFGTSSTKVAINLNCSHDVPCTNISLANIELDSAIEGVELISSCKNAFGTAEGTVKPKSCLQWLWK